MIFKEVYNKYLFCKNADRVGPDVPFTHWKLHFKSLMIKLCQNKFKRFSDTADFRAGAYAVHCSKISICAKVVVRPNTMLFADEFAEIIIEDNAIILPGVTVGENSVIGAGAIVTKNVDARTIVAGSPAKLIRVLNK